MYRATAGTLHDGTVSQPSPDSPPPSARSVHYVLRHADDLTQGTPVDCTGLSTQTVRNPLWNLEAAELVDERVCPRNARTRVCSTADD
jgi:hypothetical protein